eukprot:m.59899 g.59899  ORF g.59899 m.59899 type:complete len:739 (+) comp6988_c0_seq1:529-2745(+)
MQPSAQGRSFCPLLSGPPARRAWDDHTLDSIDSPVPHCEASNHNGDEGAPPRTSPVMSPSRAAQPERSPSSGQALLREQSHPLLGLGALRGEPPIRRAFFLPGLSREKFCAPLDGSREKICNPLDGHASAASSDSALGMQTAANSPHLVSEERVARPLSASPQLMANEGLPVPPLTPSSSQACLLPTFAPSRTLTVKDSSSHSLFRARPDRRTPPRSPRAKHPQPALDDSNDSLADSPVSRPVSPFDPRVRLLPVRGAMGGTSPALFGLAGQADLSVIGAKQPCSTPKQAVPTAAWLAGSEDCLRAGPDSVVPPAVHGGEEMQALSPESSRFMLKPRPPRWKPIVSSPSPRRGNARHPDSSPGAGPAASVIAVTISRQNTPAVSCTTTLTDLRIDRPSSKQAGLPPRADALPCIGPASERQHRALSSPTDSESVVEAGRLRHDGAIPARQLSLQQAQVGAEESGEVISQAFEATAGGPDSRSLRKPMLGARRRSSSAPGGLGCGLSTALPALRTAAQHVTYQPREEDEPQSLPNWPAFGSKLLYSIMSEAQIADYTAIFEELCGVAPAPDRISLQHIRTRLQLTSLDEAYIDRFLLTYQLHDSDMLTRDAYIAVSCVKDMVVPQKRRGRQPLTSAEWHAVHATVKRLKDLFGLLDLNADGAIVSDELRYALLAAGSAPEEADFLVGRMDKTGRGHITIETFLPFASFFEDLHARIARACPLRACPQPDDGPRNEGLVD